MDTTWILVADSSRAKVFESPDGRKPWREIEEFEHPEGRAHNRDLRTDAEGRYYGKGERQQGHVAAPQVSATEHEAELFAKHLCDHLDKARTEHRYGKLCIVAPPKFLGLLRQHLPREVEKLVAATSAKDVAWLDARSIAEYIGENLQPT
jgi:protein required for attachment to host cells